MHTRYFTSVDQVAHVFGRSFNRQEAPLVKAFLEEGTRPYPGGCWHCTESEILKLTQWIDFYERMVDDGEALDPTNDDASTYSVGLPYGPDWG